MIEHEIKLAVWPGFTLPPLDDLPGLHPVDMGEKHQEATYHDAADLRLARAGVTLRHRSDDGWTLKLPDDEPAAGALRRLETTVAGEPDALPPELLGRVAARLRTAPLEPVAHLQTRRRRTDLIDADGEIVVQVLDDEVSVLEGERVALRFREVEVELGVAADPVVLDLVVERLRAAGAGAPDPTPKVFRALGPEAGAPPDLAEHPLPNDPTAAQVLTVGIARSVRQLIAYDPGVREGDDVAVHQARVAIRRLRSDLRTYGQLLDGEWVAPLRDELRWIADALGEVRDADVLGARLRRQLQQLRRPDRVVGAALVERLAHERDAANQRLLSAMAGERYLGLLEALVDAASAPRTLPVAGEPASKVLPRLAADPWRTLEKRARRVGPKSADEELHEVRIRAKRARYAAEVASLVVGKPARKFAGRLASLQDVLGNHQDACVARDWLRRTALDVEAPVAFVAGQLSVVQDAEADEQRAAWPAAWHQANKGKLRAWLKG